MNENEEFMIVLNDNPTVEEVRALEKNLREGPLPSRGPRPPWLYPKDHPLYRPKEEVEKEEK